MAKDYVVATCEAHGMPLYHAGTYARCDSGCMIEGTLAPGAVIVGDRDAIHVPEFHEKGIEITVLRSAGSDGAVVVFIDTPNWEPNGSDGGPGLRVLINDHETYEGVTHEDAPTPRESKEAKLVCTLDDIDYLETPWDPYGGQKHRYYEENQ